jgi:hypothetical protein
MVIMQRTASLPWHIYDESLYYRHAGCHMVASVKTFLKTLQKISWKNTAISAIAWTLTCQRYVRWMCVCGNYVDHTKRCGQVTLLDHTKRCGQVTLLVFEDPGSDAGKAFTEVSSGFPKSLHANIMMTISISLQLLPPHPLRFPMHGICLEWLRKISENPSTAGVPQRFKLGTLQILVTSVTAEVNLLAVAVSRLQLCMVSSNSLFLLMVLDRHDECTESRKPILYVQSKPWPPTSDETRKSFPVTLHNL